MTAGLEIAPASDRRWHALLSGETRPEYRCLALRILMIRLTLAYARREADALALVEELRGFFRTNLRFAGDDYHHIFLGAAR